jgi:hypothetical protein
LQTNITTCKMQANPTRMQGESENSWRRHVECDYKPMEAKTCKGNTL